jgi:hypothetical protein
MESLELIEGIPFRYDFSGAGLYFYKYSYRLVVKFNSVHRIRYCMSDEDLLTKKLSSPVWVSRNPITLRELIVNEMGDIEELKKFISWKVSLPKANIKIVISINQVSFYFNNSDIIKNFIDRFNTLEYRGSYKKAIPNFSKDVIYLRNPKYTHRVYFNFMFMYKADIFNLVSTFNNYDIKICPSLKRSIDTYFAGGSIRYNRGFFITSNNFVDFNDESLITLLALKYSSGINKVCRIEQLNIDK